MRSIKNVSVAVVGGAGFLGSHLVDHLIDDRGCEVLVVDNLVSGRREFVHPKAKFAHHDITLSESYLHKLFVFHEVQYVFNYAAYPYVPDSFVRPLAVFAVNATGAMHVINAAYEAGVEAILQVSSAEIYGGTIASDLAGSDGRIHEEIPVQPHSTYGVAKAAIDYYVQARWREAHVPCIALRQFNCVGEKETHPYIVPEIIGQLNKHSCPRCAGDGKAHGSDRPFEGGGSGEYPGLCPICRGVATVRLGNNSFRDFLYAGDAVRIAVELLERGQFGEVYNLGSEIGIKMFSLAETIGKLMGFGQVKVEIDPNRIRPWEIWHLQSCNDKIYQAIGHRVPLTSLEDALKKTIAWYKSNGRKWCWET